MTDLPKLQSSARLPEQQRCDGIPTEAEVSELVEDLTNPRGHYIGDGEYRAAAPTQLNLRAADAIAKLAQRAQECEELREALTFIATNSEQDNVLSRHALEAVAHAALASSTRVSDGEGT